MPDIAASSQSNPPVALVKAGQRFTFDGTHGSADALLIARYHLAYKQQLPLLAVICASAVDAQRLSQEIGFFAPEARVRLLPDWETLPYDVFAAPGPRLRAPRDAARSRRRPLRHPARAGDHGAVPDAARVVHGRVHVFVLAGRTARRSEAEGAIDAGRLRAREPGRPSRANTACAGRCSTCTRWARRCRTGSTCSTIRSTRSARSIRTPSAVFIRCATCACCPAANFRSTKPRAPLSAAAGARWFEGDPSRASIYKDIGNGVPSAGIEYYLPLFFEETATLFHYLPERAHLVFVGDLDASIKRFTADTKQRHNFLSHDRDRADPRTAAALSVGRRFLHAREAVRTPRAAGQGRRRLGGAAAEPRDRPSRGRPGRRTAGLARHDAEPRAVRDRIGRPARDDRATAGGKRLARRFGRQLRSVARRRHPLRARRRGARERLCDSRRRHRDRHRNRTVRPARAPCGTPSPGTGEQRRFDGARPVRAEGRRPGRACAARHRTLYGSGDDGSRRRRDRIPASRVRRRKQAVRAGRATARDLALQRRRPRQRTAPLARFRPVGKGEAQGRAADPRHGRRTAEPVRAARRARRPCVQARSAGLREIRGKLRLRGNPRPGRGDRGGDRRHDNRPADGSARVRRRRIRQDRSRVARGVYRGDGRQAGRAAVADHAARRTAHADVYRSLLRLAGAHRRTVALQVDQGSQRVDPADQRRRRRHRDRHAQAVVVGRAVQAARARDHRRRASLRRTAEGSVEGAARRSRRADADRDAHSAHARHGARRAARFLGDRDRAAKAPSRSKPSCDAKKTA